MRLSCHSLLEADQLLQGIQLDMTVEGDLQWRPKSFSALVGRPHLIFIELERLDCYNGVQGRLQQG